METKKLTKPSEGLVVCKKRYEAKDVGLNRYSEKNYFRLSNGW